MAASLEVKPVTIGSGLVAQTFADRRLKTAAQADVGCPAASRAARIRDPRIGNKVRQIALRGRRSAHTEVIGDERESVTVLEVANRDDVAR